MKKFIGYFDYLGFKDFILKNNIEYQANIIDYIYRDIGNSLSKGKLKNDKYGKTADLSDSKINCINFSDTIIFWTNDDELSSLEELIYVTHRFNWQSIIYNFPLRGAIVYGEITHDKYESLNAKGGIFNINSTFGKGIIDAHNKAESQNWAGTVIDKSILDFLEINNIEATSFFVNYAKKYKIPYKTNVNCLNEEFAYCIVEKPLDESSFKALKEKIENNFSKHNKDISMVNAKEKLENTILYLKSFILDGK